MWPLLLQAGHTLVVFIGGCTRAEIAAIRTLGKRHGKRYHILTTTITSGDTFLEALDVEWLQESVETWGR